MLFEGEMSDEMTIVETGQESARDEGCILGRKGGGCHIGRGGVGVDSGRRLLQLSDGLAILERPLSRIVYLNIDSIK
jgi:hypothetical protein